MDAAPSTLILTRGEIARLMTLADYAASAEEAFRALAAGRALSPPPLHIPAEGGGFHAKGARLRTADGGDYAAIKVNGNFPGNPGQGLPTIQGAIVLSDARNGQLLAVMDSIEVTLRRTAAATALAARHLARKNSKTLTICGCGDNARAQLAALMQELPLKRVQAWDINPAAASAFATEMSVKLKLDVQPVDDMAAATKASDVIVTCTTSRMPFLEADDVRPGTFIAAIGADSHDKSELSPELMARAKVIVDVLEQCAVMGDLHHAIAAVAMTPGDVHASLADLVSGRKPGRESENEITIFDSTGTAVQDAAAAARIYQRAKAANAGLVCTINRTEQEATT